ncbi:hypothetical protein [Parashewanella tropica]|uniref:hypothetical protein n=1 Tax=Parashewanella tropica TaxID=2547970 RepID=UPI001059B22A|nr:hypothetical protein [Parashewanella tropica]
MKGFIALLLISLLAACSSHSKPEFNTPLASNVKVPQNYDYQLDVSSTIIDVSSAKPLTNLGKFTFTEPYYHNCLVLKPIRKPKYQFIYAGKLSGHSIFSPYAEYTDSHYYQVVFLDK